MRFMVVINAILHFSNTPILSVIQFSITPVLQCSNTPIFSSLQYSNLFQEVL